MHREVDTGTTHFYAAPFCLLCTSRRSHCDESKLLVSFWKCFLSGEKNQKKMHKKIAVHTSLKWPVNGLTHHMAPGAHGSKVGTKIFPEKRGFF